MEFEADLRVRKGDFWEGKGQGLRGISGEGAAIVDVAPRLRYGLTRGFLIFD